GFSEYGLKLFPLFCGIASLVVFYEILKNLVQKEIIWLPLAMLAFNPNLIEYSATIKQYSSDCLIALLLILMTLKTDVLKTRYSSFIVTWMIAGMISIAFSMPSIFVLAAVGSYYFIHC